MARLVYSVAIGLYIKKAEMNMRSILTIRGGTVSLFYLCSVFCVLIVSGCASVPREGTDALAWVDGEPVTREDIGYSLQIAHRREDLSHAKEFDISQYLQRLIDDRLIVQEARRMGMEDSPDIQKKVQEYVLRESVVRLYNEDIVGKISVSGEEVADYYRENYERFTLNVIEAGNEDEAGEVMRKLQSGVGFDEIAPEYASESERGKTKELVVKRETLRPTIQEAISGLKPGETSVIKDQGKYYIIKLVDRQAAPDEEFASVRDSIESILKDQKIKKRSDEYLVELREKSEVRIDQELLASITLEGGDKTREEWLDDKRPLVQANNMTLTAGDFVAMIPEKSLKSNKEILDAWLDIRMVDLEALSRRYDLNTDLNDMVQRYKNELLKAAFTREVITPQIKITERDTEDYYQGHQNEYAKPGRYKIQQITLKSQEDALEVLNSLSGGANFSWLAKTKSKDSYASAGGVSDWKTIAQLPEPVRDHIDNLKQGEISPVFQIEGEYLIVRLMEKSGFEVEEFSNVKGMVYKALYKEKFFEIYNAYIDKLRNEARIELNDQAIRAYEETFRK
jgi:peptidyl-prolyl cis-trans isomerase C